MKFLVTSLIFGICILACSGNADKQNLNGQNNDSDDLSKVNKAELLAMGEAQDDSMRNGKKSIRLNNKNKNKMIKEATFGAGCFWCVEACFMDLKGVLFVQPGYSGGKTDKPTYKQICEGNTGHAEVIRVEYDEEIISYPELLEAFWFVHDPTQLNRQGNDVGTQYRSVVFYHDEDQKQQAINYKRRLEEEKVWEDPIVTEISPLINYFPAEEYHTNYFERNPENAYCQAVVRPKVEKFRKVFAEKLD